MGWTPLIELSLEATPALWETRDRGWPEKGGWVVSAQSVQGPGSDSVGRLRLPGFTISITTCTVWNMGSMMPVRASIANPEFSSGLLDQIVFRVSEGTASMHDAKGATDFKGQ